MKFIRVCIAIATMSYFSVGLSIGTPAYNEDSRCLNADDPFIVPAYVPSFTEVTMHEGKSLFPELIPDLRRDVGKCVDYDKYRPILILSNTERLNFKDFDAAQYKFVANIRHDDGWYTAAIPYLQAVRAVFEVSMRDFPFVGVRGGHSEMRIYFSEPVQLFSQSALEQSKSIMVNDLVFTVNPTGFNHSAVASDPIRLINGSFLQTYGIQTREARLQFSFINSNTIKTQMQIPLNLNPKEMNMILFMRATLIKNLHLQELHA